MISTSTIICCFPVAGACRMPRSQTSSPITSLSNQHSKITGGPVPCRSVAVGGPPSRHALRRLAWRQRAVASAEIDQRRACAIMAGKAQHTADHDGVVAGILHAFEGAFEY